VVSLPPQVLLAPHSAAWHLIAPVGASGVGDTSPVPLVTSPVPLLPQRVLLAPHSAAWHLIAPVGASGVVPPPEVERRVERTEAKAQSSLLRVAALTAGETTSQGLRPKRQARTGHASRS
jgi:hypothetical protein